MTPLQILHTLFSFLPFAVCLFWLICFVVQWRKNDGPKHYMTAYLLTCVVLYLCHALYFTLGLPYSMECVWTFCSLSVYPLFYGYLCRLTSSDYTVRRLWPWLVPGLLVAVAKYVLPDAGIDRVRLLLFAIQIGTVCYFGIGMLKAFDRKLQAVYADTEERDTTAVHHLLVAIIVVSLLSGVANTVGKHFFGESLWLLVPISLAFSVMQFALCLICYDRKFTIDQLNEDDDDAQEPVLSLPALGFVYPELRVYAEHSRSKGSDGTGCDDHGEKGEDEEAVGQKIEMLMVERHYYLKKDLKIGDIVKAVGSNRTYVSNYINTTYACSFSDYMNSLRIEHAKHLLASSPRGTKLSQIAEESGYANEQSFYRNFKKFVGMTPAEWLSEQEQ